MKKLVALALTGAMVFSLAACGSSSSSTTSDSSSDTTEETTEEETTEPAADAVKLNLSVPDAESSSIGVAAKEFADELNEASEGRLDVEVYYDGSLYGGDATAAVTTMQDGGLDMLCLSSTWYASFDSKFYMVSIPYLFDSVEEEAAYINDESSQPMWDAVESLGVKYLAAWTRSFRMVTNNVKPITCPDDLKGIKLRTPGSDIYVKFFGDGCGATVSPMSFSEVYSALQTGTIDGQENPVDVPYSSSFYEVQKYISGTNHTTEAWVIGMNPDKFDSLDADLQELILTKAQEMQQWKIDYDAENDQACLDGLVEKGMEYNELTDDQMQQFKDLASSMTDDFKAIVGDDEFYDATVAFAEKN